MHRYSPLAASLMLIAALTGFLLPSSSESTYAGNVVLAPEGGRLDALDAEGNTLGPCPLKHTDVQVAVSGHLTRVTLRQQYHNPYPDKIEAVYTFPLSSRSAVDRMSMTIGDRVIVGEVHERVRARAIYDAARQAGHVAGLLEQERPNIFTQSVANIEPNAQVIVEISYVELLQSADGLYSFDFPMVVGPRYIPGSPTTTTPELPAELKPRQGLVLLCPANVTVGQAGDVSTLGTLQTGKLKTLLHAALPIMTPAPAFWNAKPDDDAPPATQPAARGPVLWHRFEVAYPDGAKDLGTLHTDGTGQLDGRWFYVDLTLIKDTGTGFAPDTGQVPDASRITPEPVKPGNRAGHDISIRVTIDTGGPGIVDLASALHEIVEDEREQRDDGRPRRVSLRMKQDKEIPNRDFVLSWRQTADAINEATFTHTGKHGNFFSLILQPPERVADAEAVARELVFVLDTSGSMSGFPIDKAKEVMAKAIDALRPADTFNLITFAGNTRILWDSPRPNTPANRAEAQTFLASRQGGGGTEMMKAINAALVQTRPEAVKSLTPEELANLPADGREVRVRVRRDRTRHWPPPNVRSTWHGLRITLDDGSTLDAHFQHVGESSSRNADTLTLTGRWSTRNRRRVFDVLRVEAGDDGASGPIRVVCFMTDGYVGNDMAIIDAIKKNAATTRVFSFGIGNSVNRYLLEGMARAGRGEVEFVLLSDEADEKVERFARRIQTPVLTDIEFEFSDGLAVTDLAPRRVRDLFDVKPLILHGRYTAPGQGTLTIRGNTGTGRYERVVPITLPESQPEHDTIATLWARTTVEELINQDLAALQHGNYSDELRNEVIRLGETFDIMTQFTSFVAVEKARVTIGGQPRLVAVPIEMPDGVSYEGVFGGLPQPVQDTDGDGVDDTLASLAIIGGSATDKGAGWNSEMKKRKEGSSNLEKLSESSPPPAKNTASDTLSLYKRPSSIQEPGTAGPASGQFGRNLTRASIQPLAETRRNYELGYRMSSEAKPTRHRGGLKLEEAVITPRGTLQRSRSLNEARIPWSQDTINPRNRPEILERGQLYSVGPIVSSPNDPTVLTQLHQPIEKLELTDKPFDKAIAQLREYAGVPIVVDHAAIEAAGIRRDAPVTVKLTQVASGEALRQILDSVADGKVDLAFWIASGVVQVSTQDDFAQRVEAARVDAITKLLEHLKSTDAEAVNRLTLVRERIAVSIAALVGQEKLDSARKLADALADHAPSFEIGVKMRDALADESLDDDTRRQRVDALADLAREVIDAARRQAELKRRLDGRLYVFVTEPDAATDLVVTDDGVRVSVLTTHIDASMLETLTAAGLRVEADSRSLNVVVGIASREALRDVALLDGVRKIDPTAW
jgi:hypothetical protein